MCSFGDPIAGMKKNTLNMKIFWKFISYFLYTGAACEIAKREMKYDHAWMEKLSKRFLDKMYSKLTHVIRNGDPEQSYAGCINLSFAYVEGIFLFNF